MIIGCHVSFGKEQLKASVEEAISYNANTFMFYTGAPQNTLRVPINNDLTNTALSLMKEHNMDMKNVICHAPYIVNPATDDESKRNFAINFLKQEVERCNTLGVKKMVLHPGSAVGIERNVALENISYVVNEVLNNPYDVVILLETMAGKGNECGKTIDELKTIIDNIKYKDKIGVCLDTCHLNDSGYDLNKFDEYLLEFDSLVGLDKIKCVHINDSKNAISSHKDRHANIGFGTIGFDTLINIIYNPKLDNIPKILETPYTGESVDDDNRLYPPYKFEIDMIKQKTFNKNLYEDVKNYNTK